MAKNIRNFVIIAHIDHGKSTLADRFLEITGTVPKEKMRSQFLDQMDLERERGITIKLQPVRMRYVLSAPSPSACSNCSSRLEQTSAVSDITSTEIEQGESDTTSNSEYILNLIDTPGHVDFSYEVSRSLAAVEGAVLLVDATQGIQAQTLANLYQAQKQNLIIIPVVNKIDLANADVSRAKAEISELLKINPDEIINVSAKTGQNIQKVLEEVTKKVPPPVNGLTDVSRALIFDSVFDAYRGVIAYVRIIDGDFSPGEKIKLLATGAETEILEVGYFSPQYTKAKTLAAGEIGYIVTGLKDISKCRVGDTVTKLKIKNLKPASPSGGLKIEALQGYHEPKPMVFASVYSIDGKINLLRDALGKLKLNDAALTFEPESSKVFGFGFRCGFLGLLHLEIVKERLEREYGMDLLITTPRVDYRRLATGDKLFYQEPWVEVEIVSPVNYIGQLMELLHRHRGVQKEVNYFSDRAILHYEAPLAEIIIGFYDELKSASQGYASMSYELIGYRTGDLAKMDVLVAGEKIDALTQIVHRDQLHNKAHAVVKRLKDLIPRQWFEVSIQAAVGGKILAREDIAAMKKDVTGYLYGGDVSRKKKLWAKQAKGKKKMKKLGKVDIPSDVFIKLLKS